MLHHCVISDILKEHGGIKMSETPSDVVSCHRKRSPQPRHHENNEDLPNKYSSDLVVLMSHIICNTIPTTGEAFVMSWDNFYIPC